MAGQQADSVGERARPRRRRRGPLGWMLLATISTLFLFFTAGEPFPPGDPKSELTTTHSSPPAPANRGPKPKPGPSKAQELAKPLPAGLANGGEVELPIFEYTVLREVREALFTGPDKTLLWQGDTTICTWNEDGGCQCDWEGVGCKWEMRKGLWQVSSISLDRRQLAGTVPPSLSELSALETLNLAYNRLQGYIPEELSALGSLQTLYLHNNHNLGGPLPDGLSRLRRLRQINLSSNSFWGPLPPEWGNLTALSDLDLSHNQFIGTLPTTWSALTGLTSLGLDNNLLMGTLPAEWTHMVAAGQQTEVLELDVYDNMLLEPIPAAFNDYLRRVIINFFPQDGQISVPTEGEEGERNGGGGEFTDRAVAVFRSGRANRLVGWLAALLTLLLGSCAWVLCARAVRRYSRLRAFTANCYLNAAERRYLDGAYDDVLLEAACDGAMGSDRVPTGSLRSRSSTVTEPRVDSVLEMGLIKQSAALSAAGTSSAHASSSSSSASNIRTLAPPPRVRPTAPRFSLEEIMQAVKGGVRMGNSAGEASLGPCYAGKLRDRQVGVKVLSIRAAGAGTMEDGGGKLLTVKSATSGLEGTQHPNLLAPIASGVVREEASGVTVYLAYEAAPSGSLQDWLAGTQGGFMTGMPLPWPTRLRHAHEIAEGLAALRTHRRVHGALHPGNVLLDGALHARLVHAGLLPLLLQMDDPPAEDLVPPDIPPVTPQPPAAPLSDIESPFMAMMASSSAPTNGASTSAGASTSTAGSVQLRPRRVSSRPHTDPQYFVDGVLNSASDVYSLGVILLQLLTGRANAEGLVEEVRDRMVSASSVPADLLDPEAGPWLAASVASLAGIALACTEPKQRHRPNLKFHVLPKLATLSREANSWLMPSSGPVSLAGSTGRLATVPDGTPSVFLCPILREPMSDPVVAADGFTYERDAIQRWMDESMNSGLPTTSPMTNLPLNTSALVPVHALRAEIAAWQESSKPSDSGQSSSS